MRIHIKPFDVLWKISWAVYAQGASIEYMGVNHGCFYILVAHQLLNRTDILAALQKVRGEGVAEGMRRGRFGDPGSKHSSAHRFLNHTWIQVVPPLLSAL